MAKRSDFAQKLLDDLRLRKERLASSSQSSNRSNSSLPITDPCSSNARQNHRIKDARTNERLGSRTGVARNSGSNGIGRPSSHSEHQNHIVPYSNGRSQTSHQISDLSTALAFALENAGKISRSDSSPRSSMFELLQRIGAKSMEPGKNGTRSVRFPEFSPVQIEEISKGVRRMNRILRGNLDKKETMKIGEELLKGAIDLENSLKMRIAEPQRKNRSRIEILDEADQDDGKVAEEWNLDRRRFPFDEKEIGRSSLNQRPISQNSQEKARIPNVIAKLMGLENLPEEGGSSSRITTREIVENPKNDFLVKTSFFVARERNSLSHVGIEEDLRPTKAVMKNDKPHEIVKKNLDASSHSLPQKIKPEKQSSRNQTKKSLSNDHTEMKRSVFLKLGDIRNQSVKHKANSMNSKISPENRSNNKIAGKSGNSTRGNPSVEPKTKEDNSADSNIANPRSFSPRKSDSEPRRPRARVMDEKAVRVEKSKATKAQNKRNDGSILNSMTRSKSQRSSVLKEVKRARIEKPIRKNEADQSLIRKAEETCDQITRLREAESLARSDDFCQIKILDDHLNRETFRGDPELEHAVDTTIELDEMAVKGPEIATRLEEEEEESRVREPILISLTESENKVKQILIKSQAFLNTAEALFSLDIPIAILHRSAINNDDEDHHRRRSPVMECGYEIMRRKGRRHELSVHPNYRAIVSAPIRSFEGLVRELSRDFERLRVYGRPGSDLRCKDECNLAGILESDVYGRENDVNCMWDFGWNERVFAFAEVDEIVREFEKFLLNRLLDEIAVDIFSSYAL